MKKVLAVQVPAPCPLSCGFCRTPEHNKGNLQAVLGAVIRNINVHDELYITSNGETGFSPIFMELIEIAQKSGKNVSVLCATEKSIVPGLCRVEISLNQFTEPLAQKAIAKAKLMNIPIVLSLVDQGVQTLDAETITTQHDVDGVLVRACQREGRSKKETGSSSFFQKVGSRIGLFPAKAYAEISKCSFGFETTCINHNGEIVSLLGA